MAARLLASGGANAVADVAEHPARHVLLKLRMGIAVSTATDVVKSAAGILLTEPVLAGIVASVGGPHDLPAGADLHAALDHP